MLLIVPSASVASGVVTYVLGQLRALQDLDVAVVAPEGSHLAERAAARVVPIPDGGAASIASALKRADAVVMTHGPRALLAARRARVPRRRLHHVFHEQPWRAGRLGAGEVALSAGAHRVANSPLLARRLGAVPLV